MSRIDRGKKVTLTYREKGPGGKAVLVVEVAADDDILPHEHREDMRQAAAAVLDVPVSTLPDDVEVELKRTGGDHHPHPSGPVGASDTNAPEKQKA